MKSVMSHFKTSVWPSHIFLLRNVSCFSFLQVAANRQSEPSRSHWPRLKSNLMTGTSWLRSTAVSVPYRQFNSALIEDVKVRHTHWNSAIRVRTYTSCPGKRLTFKDRASYIYRTGVPLPSRCCILYILFNNHKYWVF